MPADLTVSEKAFVDTNVFAYAEDRREPVKRPKALALIQQLTFGSRWLSKLAKQSAGYNARRIAGGRLCQVPITAIKSP